MKIDVPGGVNYHYNVDLKFLENIEKVTNRKLLLEAINLFKKKYSKIFLNPHAAVFDGSENIFTCKNMFPSRELEGDIEIKEHADSSQGHKIKVILKYAGSVDVKYAVEEYFRLGIKETKLYNAIQAFNIMPKHDTKNAL